MKTMKMLSACLLLLPFISCTQVQDTKNDAVIEQKIETLLSSMTLEEKIGQMNQISSYGNIEDMSGLIKKGEVGSILNEVDPVRVNALQRVAMEESRLGIPLLMARDVIHGFKTIFPIPLGQAASFNPQVAKDGARVAAVEASAVGIRWTFAPMIDVARDPRWGRMAEGCGEDTYLTSVMGVAMVEGFQGDSLNSPTSIAACPKHFVGYGAAEGGRDYNSTFIPERRLRDVYLPPFEAVAKAGAATFMTSFNDNDGAPSTGNTFILKDVLRGEWGFDGIVVSDWASVAEMMAHGFAADSKEAAMKAVNAGVDMEMVSYTFVKELPELIKEGKVKKSAIDDAVRNILRIKFRLGLFDNPYVDEKRIEELYAPSHLEAAKQAAVESVILLKNEKETLPLQSSVKTVAVVGPMANAPYDQLGTWIFDGDKTKTVTPLKAIKELVGDKVQVIYEPGLTYSRDKNMAGGAKSAAGAAPRPKNPAADAALFLSKAKAYTPVREGLMDEKITSRENAKIKYACRLASSAAFRRTEGRFLAEGRKLCPELARGAELETLFYTENALEKCPELTALPGEHYLVEDHVADKLADVGTHQGVFGVFRTPVHSLEEVRPGGRYLALERVQDPGNVGTLLRSAAAFGFDGVILSEGCASVYAPKTLRASMGAAVRIPVIETGAMQQAIALLRENGITCLAAALYQSQPLSAAKAGYPGGVCVVIGSEGQGLTDETIAACNSTVRIP